MSDSSLREAIDGIRIIDAHEHLMEESERSRYAIDFSYLLPHYLPSDLVSAGLAPDLLESVRLPMNRFRAGFSQRMHLSRYTAPRTEALSLRDRWQALRPYWNAVRNTSYARQVLMIIRDIWEIDDLNDETCELLSERIAASRRAGWYRHILHDRAGVDVSLNDVYTTDVDREFFAPVMRVDHLIHVGARKDVEQIESGHNRSVRSPGDLEQLIGETLKDAAARGAVALKSGLAYERPLLYETVSRRLADVSFDRLAGPQDPVPAFEEVKPLQDYLMHAAVRAAVDLGLPIQFHTGLLEGNGNKIENAHPALLRNLFETFPQGRFDLLHAGYPYWEEWVTLSKMYANVYANLTWTYIISPGMSGQVLDRLIEMVPQNKIIGFGGDAIIVEEVYAHAKTARQVIARTLSGKVQEGYFRAAEAAEFARRILRENPIELYGLDIRKSVDPQPSTSAPK